MTDGCRLQVVNHLPQVRGNPQVERYHHAAVESTSGKIGAKESIVNTCMFYHELQLLLTVNPTGMGWLIWFGFLAADVVEGEEKMMVLGQFKWQLAIYLFVELWLHGESAMCDT